MSSGPMLPPAIQPPAKIGAKEEPDKSQFSIIPAFFGAA